MRLFNKKEHLSQSTSEEKDIPIKGYILFFILLCYELFLFFIPLLTQYRIPKAHDGLCYFLLQYYFLNNSVIFGEIPQWIPLLTHGTVFSWIFSGQASLFQNVLSMIGPLLYNLNFIPLFLIGIFMDNLVLMVGCWLLGKKLFDSSLTTFFVCSTILGSAIWPFQPWLNFHFYYAVPLILFLGHEWLETSRWKYFLLAGNLLALQICGQPGYFLSMTSLIIFLYFLFYCILNHQTVWEQIKKLHFRKSFFISVFLAISSLTFIYSILTIGTDQLIHYSPNRLANGTVDLTTFLTYGQSPKLFLHYSWKELLTGLPISLDYTLYIGILPLPLILIGLFCNSNKKKLHLLMTTWMIILICSGTFVAIFFYYTWPTFKMYRHLTYASVFAKLFMCFLAGFGMDALLKDGFPSKKISKIILFLLSGILLFLAFHVLIRANNLANIRLNLLPFIETFSILKQLKFDETFVVAKLLTSFMLLCLTGISLMAFCFLRSSKIKTYLIIALICFQAAHMYDYKWKELERQTYPADLEFRSLTQFQPASFSIRRQEEKEKNFREKIFESKPISAIYSYKNAFLFKDQIDHQLRVDYGLKPLNNFMKAYWGQSLKEQNTLPLGLIPGQRMSFPLKHTAAKKIAGLTEDKIQFFENAYFVSNEQALADLITQPNYEGDLLFVSNKSSVLQKSPLQDWTSQKTLSANERLRLSYEIIRFDSNNLILKTFNKSSQPIWLMYSDVWHPFWKSSVNGISTPVYQANLAYKAILLQPGENKIHFRFESKLTTILLKILGLNSLFWIIYILGMSGKILLKKNEE